MSKIVCPFGRSSLLEQLKYGDCIEPLPATTMWWRQRLFPGPDGNESVTQLDHPTEPTEVTITWHDRGRDETLRPYAARIIAADDDDRAPMWRDITSLRYRRPVYYLDVLWHDTPTGPGLFELNTARTHDPTLSTGWEPLTQPGHHVHPADREWVDRLRRQLIADMMPRIEKAAARGDQTALSTVRREVTNMLKGMGIKR